MKINKKGWLIGILGLMFLWGWWDVLPFPLFTSSYSTVLLDGQDRVVGMTVAADGQFRFPETTHLPLKYTLALITFEDRRFVEHRGVDGLALGRAALSNWRRKKIVSGGSTISMQVIRLSRNNPPRTYWEKFREICLAFRLEQSYSKLRILQLYASHAPFGGNIVGLEAAALKYFNRLPKELSWGEAAFLAILPNAPALKNGGILKRKRDKLLEEMYKRHYLSEEDYRLACEEPIPQRAQPTECIAPHLLAQGVRQRKGRLCPSFLDAGLQQRVNEIVERHSRMLSGNLIYNMAVLVAHIPSGEVRAYVGNSSEREGSRGNEVDIITSVRSSGSILKPALYALMQQNGYILPATLVADIPSRFGGYVPSNFNRSFLGVAPADRALAMSLNIPFVRMLKEYNYSRFYEDLKQLGITSLTRPADDYGLSLILGGAETSLWDLCNMYGGMVSVIRHYNECDGSYFSGEYNRLRLWREGTEGRTPEKSVRPQLLEASAIWLTLKALQQVERPEMESGWRNFASRLNLSWKTGTSFGFRDAWAIGVNADWVVGVWVGNADGEGRPGLVGVRAAAPVLFEVVGLLPVTDRLYEPSEEFQEVAVCRQSGYRAGRFCEDADTVKVCVAGINTPICPYHRLVYLDSTGLYRVTSECESVDRIQVRPWFVLPPVQEWYYVRSHGDYRKLPPYRSDCQPIFENVMEMIYPPKDTRVFIPREFGGKKGKVVFELAHRRSGVEVFWHIDDRYIGSTRYVHQMEIDVTEGVHVLTIVDATGNTLRQTFRVVGKDGP